MSCMCMPTSRIRIRIAGESGHRAQRVCPRPGRARLTSARCGVPFLFLTIRPYPDSPTHVSGPVNAQNTPQQWRSAKSLASCMRLTRHDAISHKHGHLIRYTKQSSVKHGCTLSLGQPPGLPSGTLELRLHPPSLSPPSSPLPYGHAYPPIRRLPALVRT